ncbi:methylenetetrahydrofolate reductase C-terminal domain-containing protein [Desulfuromonas sp. AOP6]|uniref:methylenetetrahydrofolate reductase C-terminal domain-containing protein n=1 Tax=Desulfuromonas sp. AOP6 TaxID=1566351 RepID=UPI00126E33E1|nr:methylenetetrahydrofolate reductase C-terminal domain-containing protein [Desulfuromonas sp. AOP6]BCA78961.1 5,10-methylenetetrahydrofolatereductase-associated protein [Desulfuromonas sp. AOP6]
MIISQQKNREELLHNLEGKKRLFLVGCGACATACKSGGEEEVFQLQEWLASVGREVTGSVIIDEACHIMRAARDLRHHRDAVAEADALVVLACGAGVQSISTNTDKRVIAGLDSLFLGNIRRLGQYEEKCSLCGECILNETAGICPVTTCAKGLLNGPCGGMEEGRCEADREVDCAWHSIYERLKKQGRQGVFARPVPPKNWGKLRKPGRLKLG